MAALLQPYRELLETYYHEFHAKLLDQLSQISTTTYLITVLAICIPPIIALTIYEREEARLRAEQPKGCRKLGLKIESNLLNEFDKKFSEGRPPSTEETSAEWWRLKSLWIYPVKSCRGVELNRGTVVASGMEYDRQFTFAQLKSPFPVAANTPDKEKAAHKWEFITQRDYPLLAKVRTEMWVPDQSVDTYTPHCEDVESGGVIILSFPYQEAGWRGTVAKWGAAVKGTYPEMHFRIPFDPSPVQIEKAGYSSENLTIWKDTISALNMEAEIPDELRYYLGISNKLGLFRIDNSKSRDAQNATTKTEPDWQPVSGFQDAHPMHLVNLASIRAAERNLPAGSPRLSASKFRANLIITGPEAFHEDSWRRVKIGFYEYDISPRITRSRLRSSDLAVDGNHPGPMEGCLGMLMAVCNKDAAVRVGDEITVLEVAEHATVK